LIVYVLKIALLERSAERGWYKTSIQRNPSVKGVL